MLFFYNQAEGFEAHFSLLNVYQILTSLSSGKGIDNLLHLIYNSVRADRNGRIRGDCYSDTNLI